MSDAPAVRCRGLTYAFGERRAVDDVDLDVWRGEMFGLLGPNGAGKTTTIRVLTTLLRVAPGAAEILGHDVARERMTVRKLIGYVPQQLSAEAALTGRENVMLFARLFDVPRRERSARAERALEAGDRHARARRPPRLDLTRAGWCGASSSPRRWSTVRACSSSTSRRSAWIRSREPRCGS
jgi:ABC-2 type transport system ATP-binding protein